MSNGQLPPRTRNRVRPTQEGNQTEHSTHKVAEGFINVSRIDYASGEVVQETNREETVRVPVFHTTPAKLKVEGSITSNLGNYESCRVSVSIEMPCYPTDSELQRCYEYVSAKIGDLIESEQASMPQEEQ